MGIFSIIKVNCVGKLVNNILHICIFLIGGEGGALKIYYKKYYHVKKDCAKFSYDVDYS